MLFAYGDDSNDLQPDIAVVEKGFVPDLHRAQVYRGAVVAHAVPCAFAFCHQIVIAIYIWFGLHQPKLFCHY